MLLSSFLHKEVMGIPIGAVMFKDYFGLLAEKFITSTLLIKLQNSYYNRSTNQLPNPATLCSIQSGLTLT